MEPIAPDENSPFVAEARPATRSSSRHPDLLLRQFGCPRVVLCGHVAEQCALYSAPGAGIRPLDAVVAADAVAHIDPDLAEAALRMMERNMSAEIRVSREISFDVSDPSPTC